MPNLLRGRQGAAAPILGARCLGAGGTGPKAGLLHLSLCLLLTHGPSPFQLLQFDPKRRLGSGGDGVAKLKSHPFFSSLQWSTLVG